MASSGLVEKEQGCVEPGLEESTLDSQQTKEGNLISRRIPGGKAST